MLYSKLPQAETTIFTVMSALANQHKAINLAQGFPDFEVPIKLKESIVKYVNDNKMQYAPMQGLLELRQAIAGKISGLYKNNLNPIKQICITAGATQAIFTAIMCLIHTGDEVIIFNPSYDCYAPAVLLAGGKPIFIDLDKTDFKVDFTKLKSAINTNTKLIIVNNPNNPAGSVFSIEELNEFSDLCDHFDGYFLSDEVYEHMVYDGNIHRSFNADERLKLRSFVVSSFGKTYHATGLKIGYITGPEHLMKEFFKVHQFNVFSVSTPIQYAYTEILNDKVYYNELSDFYEAKRNLFFSLFKDLPFTWLPCKGAYFAVADYSKIAELHDIEFSKKLTIEAGVACIPLSPFYNNTLSSEKRIRFCFAKKNETLELASQRLKSYFHIN
jgi:methionine aminotransferase